LALALKRPRREESNLKIIDVSGLSCPIPVIRTKKEIDAGEKEIIIKGNTQVSRENISRLAVNSGYGISIIKDKKDDWEMKISK
jgi:tRNA 2-thiouridine synthesizing protein A